MTLILSLLLLIGVGGGVFFMYRTGLRGPGDAPRPVGAPVGEVRSAAPPQAQAPDPAAGLSIYKDDPNAAPAAPAFVPPPEQPAPRPVAASAAAPVTAQALPPASSAPKPVSTKPPAPKPPALEEGALTASASPAPPTAAAPAHAKAKAAKAASIDTILADAGPGPKAAPLAKASAPAKAASNAADPDAKAPDAKAPGAKVPAAKVSPPPAGKSGPVVVQIGAYSSKDLAEAGWNAAAGAAPGSMAGKAKHVVPVTKANGATLYRTSITGFDGRDQALALCARLKAAGQSCFVR